MERKREKKDEVREIFNVDMRKTRSGVAPPGLCLFCYATQASLAPLGLRFSLGCYVKALRANVYDNLNRPFKLHRSGVAPPGLCLFCCTTQASLAPLGLLQPGLLRESPPG
jgi:hypothetical protein